MLRRRVLRAQSGLLSVNTCALNPARMKKKNDPAAEAQSELPAGPAKVRVLLVDDHPLLRRGLRTLIDQNSRYEVCAEAADAPHALEMLRQHQPDMAVVDITLNSTNGIELTKNLCAQKPGLQVLIMSVHDEQFYAERALRAGARGYLMKNMAGEEVFTALDRIRSGVLYVSPALKEKMLHRFVNGQPQALVSPVQTLSDREMEVFELIGEGFSTQAIASRLHLSVKTIDSYREHIKTKLNLSSGSDLLRHAIQWMKSESRL